MAAVSLNSGCVHIADQIFCSPAPGGVGAVCDNFLTSNQQILTEAQWTALMQSWLADGQVLECTNSGVVANIKKEIEDLCSKTTCTYDTKQAVKALQRMLDTAETVKGLQ